MVDTGPGLSDEQQRRLFQSFERLDAARSGVKGAGIGLVLSKRLVEMIELPDHPWFVGCQFHPELKSRPTRPHPLFAAFIGASLAHALGDKA